MTHDTLKTDIRLIKLKHYISRRPEKAIGYYCLARLYMRPGSYGVSEQLLNKALLKDQSFSPALTALIEVYVKQGRFLKAVRFYQKNRNILESRNIFKIRTARAVTSAYDPKRSVAARMKNIAPLYLLNPVSGFLDERNGNLVALLLLGMHKIANNIRDIKALSLYKGLLNMDGISDSFRFGLLKMLARHTPFLYEDKDVASLFSGIPAGCTTRYANLVFDTALKSEKYTRIMRMFGDLRRQNHPISFPNQWKYIMWKRNISELDHSVFECCRNLLKAGWMDRILAKTMAELRNQNEFSLTVEEKGLLELFGYQ